MYIKSYLKYLIAHVNKIINRIFMYEWSIVIYKKW